MQPREERACGSFRLELPAVGVEAKCFAPLEDRSETVQVEVGEVLVAEGQRLPRLFLGETVAMK